MAVAKVSPSVLPFARLVGLSRWHRCSRKMSSNERILVACSASAAGAPAAVAAPLDSRHLDMERRIPGLMRWVEFCNNGAAAAAAGEFLPLRVDGRAVGYLKPSFVERLLGFPEVFVQGKDGRDVEFHSRLASQQDRTAALAGVLQQLRGEGAIDGWRDELYPAVQSFHDEPAFLIERAAAPYFGIKAYGVHVNGYVVLPDGSKELWVARRSKTKPTWPGKLDHIVAGGQPHGLSCAENVRKECQEEASIPAELAAKATAAGAVSYTSLQPAGLKRDVLFCYDLEVPADFVPQPQDGEVEEFFRLPVEQVAQIMATTSEFKENCTLVICDWLLRHGYITPDMKGHLKLLTGLRSGDCS